MARKPLITQHGQFTVETEWDDFLGNWISQIKDAEGNLVGKPAFASNRTCAEINHQGLLDSWKTR